MAVGSLPLGSVLYIDTAPLIYLLEQHHRHAPRLASLLRRINEHTLSGVTSYITMTELLVKPFEAGRDDLVRRYRDVLTSSPNFRVLPVDEDVAVEAARIRGTTGIRLADAVHLATAKVAQADVFLTNDAGLRSYRELRVLMVDELGTEEDG